jgi:hypothetical protein
MLHLLNSAILVNEGVYRYRKIEPETAKKMVQGEEEIKSYIGYVDTLRYMMKILQMNIPLNRGMIDMKEGDRALVCKLKYRLNNPKGKGNFTPRDEDYEWGLLERIK